ncbi:hypothetical protein OG900_21075 [Streptomyces sp. NBC_00433]
MSLTPKYPQAPAVPEPYAPHPPACHCQPTTPARRTAPTVAVIAGGSAAVVTVGVVLTALLVAVTVAAVSVAVVAVVLRSLLTPPRQP